MGEMTAWTLLGEARGAGLKVRSEGGRLVVQGPRRAEHLAKELLAHKEEVLLLLRKPRLLNGPPQWHAKEVERLVHEKGIVIFWAELFNELVAFIADQSFRSKVPADIVCYDMEEIPLLSPDDGTAVSDHSLRFIHQAKKLGGGRVSDIRE